MTEKTNKERLAAIETSIIHIDKNVDLMVTNNKEQWKAINKNSQSIAGIKGAAWAISAFVSFIVSIAGILWSMFKAKSS